MKLHHSIYTLSLLSLVLGCTACSQNNQVKTSPTEEQKLQLDSVAQVADFEVVPHINHHAEAPFSVVTKLKSFTLYTQADKASKRMTIEVSPINQFGSLYGFGEVTDFFKVHYQLINDPRTTVLAYVSKEEFIKSSKQQITGNINEIRYMQINGQDVDTAKLKSHVLLEPIDEQTYQKLLKQASRNSLLDASQKLEKDSKNNYLLKFSTGEIQEVPAKEDEEGSVIIRTYLGYAPSLNAQIFKAVTDQEAPIYEIYNLDQEYVQFLVGLPKLSPDQKMFIAGDNDREGFANLNLSLIRNKKIENKYYINYTKFLFVDPDRIEWLDNKTLICAVVNPNALSSDRSKKEIIPQYVRIVLQ